jgi:hypothetical protein
MRTRISHISIGLGFALLGVVFQAEAQTTRKVCATQPACAYTNAQLQQAMIDAMPGDTILLQGGFLYLGQFIMPDEKSCPAQNDTCFITLATGVDATGALLPSTNFPPADVRVTDAHLPNLATLQATTNTYRALKTVLPDEITPTGVCPGGYPCITKWWRIQNLAMKAEPSGYSQIVAVGSNSQLFGPNEQDLLSEQPDHLEFDRVYVYGDPVKGNERGFYISAKNVVIKNSYIKDIKYRAERQAITILNADGPITLENNRIEGSGENLLTEGGGVRTRQNRTVLAAPAPTTTSATFDAVTDLRTNQWFGIFVGGHMYARKVVSIAGSLVTWTPALPTTPDVPGTVWWHVFARNLTIRKNWFYKPPEWRDPILTAPQNLGTTPLTTGGTLAAGTYFYKVTARLLTAGDQWVRSAASSEVAATTTTATSRITISWQPVPTATEYYIYGRSSGGQTIRFSVTSAAGCSGNTCSFTDTGAAGTTEAVPTSGGNVWIVKNNFEMKGCDNCLIEGNVFDYSWVQAQSGGIVLLKTSNQDGNLPSVVLRDVTFRYNKVRHGLYPLLLSQYEGFGTTYPYRGAGQFENISITQNIFEDISSAYSPGSTAATIAFVTSGDDIGIDPNYYAPKNIVIEFNTGLHFTGNRGAVQLDWDRSVGDPDPQLYQADGVILRNNMLTRGNTGVYRLTDAGQVRNEGQAAWDITTKGTRDFSRNIIAGASCTIYPANNYCPTVAQWQAEFVNFAGGNYRLAPGSIYQTASSTGGPIGANLDLIEALTNIALSGDNRGGPPLLTAPSISTTSVSDPRLNQSYTFTLGATGGTTPYTWTLTSGSLPAGLTLSSGGVLSGIATTFGEFTFLTRVTGGNAAFSERSFTVNVEPLTEPDTRPDVINLSEGIFLRRDVCPDGSDVTDPPIRMGDLCHDLTAGFLKYASMVGPAIVWSPVDSGGAGTDAAPYDQATVFAGATAPTGSPAPVEVGDLWVDTTTNVAKIATSTGPITFIPIDPGAVLLNGQSPATTMVLGTLNAQNMNIRTNNITRVKLESGAVTLQGGGTTDPEFYASTVDASDYLGIGFNTANGRRVIAQVAGGTHRVGVGLGDAEGDTTKFVFGVATSSNSGGSWTRWLGVRQDGNTLFKRLFLESGTRPTCDTLMRGAFWHVAGGAGVKDTIEFCEKDAAEAYAWAALDAAGGGGGGAPTTASYLALGADATLSAERVLTAGTGITFTDAGAGGALTVATSTAVPLMEGNTVAGAMVLGTNNSQPIQFETNDAQRMLIDNSQVLLDPSQSDDPQLRVTTGSTGDTYNMGFSTGNGRKIYQEMNVGTFRTAVGSADATTGTDYIFGVSSSVNSGTTWNRYLGVRSDGMVTVERLTLESGTRPTCDVTTRGMFWYVAGATGVKDTVEVCAKDADNAYIWRVIY